jgi:hypothetical protein
MIMKNSNKYSLVKIHWNILVFLMISALIGALNNPFISSALQITSHKLYINPGEIAWIITLYLLISDVIAETEKKRQAPVLAPVSLRSRSAKIAGIAGHESQKARNSLQCEMKWGYHINDNRFASKSRNRF